VYLHQFDQGALSRTQFLCLVRRRDCETVCEGRSSFCE
jgi:hypothetical protein